MIDDVRQELGICRDFPSFAFVHDFISRIIVNTHHYLRHKLVEPRQKGSIQGFEKDTTPRVILSTVLCAVVVISP